MKFDHGEVESEIVVNIIQRDTNEDEQRVVYNFIAMEDIKLTK